MKGREQGKNTMLAKKASLENQKIHLRRRATPPTIQTLVYIASIFPKKFKFVAMNALHTFARNATGVTNFKQTTKFECVIGAMLFIVGVVTKWINVKIVGKSYVLLARLSCRANFVGVGCARTVQQLVDGE